MTKNRTKRSRSAASWNELDPYLAMWMSLTPAERLRRSWRMRTRLRNLEAIHDAKTFPDFPEVWACAPAAELVTAPLPKRARR